MTKEQTLNGRMVLTFSLSAIVGLAVGINYQNLQLGMDAFVGTLIALWCLCLLIWISLFLAVLVHELGHYLAGCLVGFDLLYVSVFSWGVRLEQSRYRFFKLPGVKGGGRTVMAPRVLHGYRNRFALLLLGGPLASLAYTGCTLKWLVSASYPISVPPIGPFLWSWMAPIFAVGALSVLPATLWPYKSRKGSETDVLWLWNIYRDQFDEHRLCCNLLLSKMAFEGVRPRDWNREWVDGQCGITDNSEAELRGLIMKADHLSDLSSPELEACLKRQAEILEGLTHYSRSTIFKIACLQQAFYAFENGDMDGGTCWLDKCAEPCADTRAEFLLCKALRAACDGQLDEAESLTNRAEAELRDYIRDVGGKREQEFDKIESLRQRVQELRQCDKTEGEILTN